MTSPPLAEFISLSSVRLSAGRELHAQQTASASLRRLDTDRLLTPFRRQAGLLSRARSYGGWASDGLYGHTAGHVLSAASMLAAGGGADGAEIVTALVHGHFAVRIDAHGSITPRLVEVRLLGADSDR